MRYNCAALSAVCLVLLPLASANASTDKPDHAPSDVAVTHALRQALAVDDHNAESWRRLAAAEAQAGNLGSAYSAITRAITLAPADRDIQVARANILLWRHQSKQAQDQAAAVRAVDPAYPGLPEFDAALARETAGTGTFDLVSIALSGSVARVKFPGAARQNWRSTALGIAFGNPRRTVFEVEADAESRTSTEIRISGRATTRIPTGSYYVGGSVTLDPTFRDKWRAVAGGETRLAPHLQASLDVRLAHYREGLVAAVEPGLTYRTLPVLSISARAINLIGADGRYLLGAAFRADFEPSDRAAWFLSAARYPDREEDGIRQLRAIALGARFNLDRHWQLRLAAADEQRESSYRRRTASLGLAYRFVAP